MTRYTHGPAKPMDSPWELYKKIEKLQADNTKAWSKVSVAEYRTEQLLKENAALYESLAEVVESLKAVSWNEYATYGEDWPEVIKAEALLARRP